jgi:hypothetical protein
MKRLLYLQFVFGICFGLPVGLGQQSDVRDSAWDLAINPHKVVGVESCEKCHANEVKTWKQTPHSETFLTLHRKAEAQQIAGKLGIASFKTDSNCIQCHYTVKEEGGKQEAISGVSCESCHGAAKDWIGLHNDFGGPGIARQSETNEHRMRRLADSIHAGMRNPINVYLVAQSCYRCHTVPDEKLVNVGGHVAGSLDFEIVSWSQGLIRHNFLRTDGKSNAMETPERLRLLFVAGMIADLESSLRATAKATEKATYGVTSAQRTARAADRLKAAQAKLKLPILDEILAVFGSVQLRLKNREPLMEAADRINALGLKFAATVRGDQLAAIEPYIPTSDKWK